VTFAFNHIFLCDFNQMALYCVQSRCACRSSLAASAFPLNLVRHGRDALARL
jgi:hypothetical protein